MRGDGVRLQQFILAEAERTGSIRAAGRSFGLSHEGARLAVERARRDREVTAVMVDVAAEALRAAVPDLCEGRSRDVAEKMLRAALAAKFDAPRA